MSSSPKLGLTLTNETDADKKFLDWRTELCSDDDGSNMMILDREIGALKEKVIWSATQPVQDAGGTWNEILHE